MEPNLSNLLQDSLKHERIRKQLDATSKNLLTHIKTIQELRTKYQVRGLMRVQRSSIK